MGELNLDNILSDSDIDNLFSDDTTEEVSQDQETTENNTENKDKEETTEINTDELFDESESESVGSEDNKDGENTKSQSGNSLTFSSLANALRDEGVFPDLTDEELVGIKSPEDFLKLIQGEIAKGIDEGNKAAYEAIHNGANPTEADKLNNSINYLNSITEEAIEAENQEGENLRKQLIFYDYINRGFSKERAEREVNKSIDRGEDIEDAKEALLSNLQHYKQQYNTLIKEAKDKEQQAMKALQKQQEDFKNNIMENSKYFGDVEVDKATRQKIYETAVKPIYKDPNTGQYHTALTKMMLDDNLEFTKNVALFYTLTDGFKNIDKLVQPKVNKEIKKGLKALENTLNNTRSTGGKLSFASGVDSESTIGSNWVLDI